MIPSSTVPLAFLYGIDPGVNCRNFAAHILWFLGSPDQAVRRSDEALTLARELAHSHSLAFALSFAASLHQYRREEQATQEQAEALITLATEHGFPQVLQWGTVLRGWALAEQGQAEEGIAQIRRGLAAGAIGSETLWRYYLNLMCNS